MVPVASVLYVLLQEAIHKRLEKKQIQEEKLQAILKAAQLAPSACNGQPYHVTVCTGDTARQVAKACMGMGMNNGMPMNNGYAPANGFNQPMNNGYNQPMNNGYNQPMNQGYNQQPAYGQQAPAQGMNCPYCGAPVTGSFCGACGAQLNK